MRSRDEVLREFGRKDCVDNTGSRVEWIDKPWSKITDAMADRIRELEAAVREELAKFGPDAWEAERLRAETAERERDTAERERDEARRELKALKERDALVMKCPVCDDRKAHAHCVHELRHRAERMERVMEAVRAFVHCERTDNVAQLLGAMGEAVRALDATPTQ